MFKIANFKSAVLGCLILAGTFAQSQRAEAADIRSVVVAGGCFWCVEADFEKVKGVKEAVSGYAGGSSTNPTYKQVTRGGSGHYEVVKITYDADQVGLDRLLSMFFRSVDPTDAGGQFCDRGESYRTAIFVDGAGERSIAEAAKADAQAALGKTIVTPILAAAEFWEAEDYHQDYYKGQNRVLTRFGPIKQSKAYKRYREACGRDARVRALWGAEAPFAGS